MCSPRSCLAEDSPSTQRTASITFDLPQPLGPTTPTSCPGTAMEVGSTKDLKPESFTEVSLKGATLDTETGDQTRDGPGIRASPGRVNSRSVPGLSPVFRKCLF